MSKPPRARVAFERTRLLHRSSSIDLWAGSINDRGYLLKRTRAHKKEQWEQFLIQSRIHHPFFLRPDRAGVTSGDVFYHAIPVDFDPQPFNEEWNEIDFAIDLLSLILALLQRNLNLKWDPHHLVYNPQTRKILTAGVSSISHVDLPEHSRLQVEHLNRLRRFLSRREKNSLDGLIRKWERRKSDVLEGCLSELLTSSGASLNRTITVLEWLRAKELELAAGLLRLAESSAGRVILFTADPGEGRSVLLDQVWRDLLSRNIVLTRISVARNGAPFQTIHHLFDQYLDACAGEKHRKNISSFSCLMSNFQSASEQQMESEFLNSAKKICEDSRQPSVLIIDDIDLADLPSIRFLNHLFQEIASFPVLFFLSSTKGFGAFQSPVLQLPLEPTSSLRMESSYLIPLWKEEQRKSYLSQIHEKTSGNGLLVREYLSETIRLRQTQHLKWTQSEWSFSRPEIPSLPDSLLDLYLERTPDLDENMHALLKSAAVQGESFDPALIEMPVNEKAISIERLLHLEILIAQNGMLRFRKPLLADAIYKKMDIATVSLLHSQLAGKLLKSNQPGMEVAVSRHYLKGKKYSEALELLQRSLKQRERGVEAVALPLLEEFGSEPDGLNSKELCDLHTLKGDLLFHRGRYGAACSSFEQALHHADSSKERQFEIGMKQADSHLTNQEIHDAQSVLQAYGEIAGLISNPKTLFRYYFLSGICQWHRGPRRPDLFERAFVIAENGRDYHLLAEGYRRYAGLVLQDGDLKQARILVRKAIRFARRIDDYDEIGHAFRILASIGWRQSKPAIAERFWKRSILAHRQVSNEYGQALAWNLSANVLVEQYRFSEAIKAFQRAIRILSRLDNKMQVTLAEFNLGLVYLELRRLKEAEDIFIQCKKVDQGTGNKRYYAFDLRALAGVCMIKGYHKKAGRLLRRTIEICTDLNAESDILQTQMILLLNELEQRNYRQSRPLVIILEKRLEEVEEPLTRAEIQYLLAHYYGYINETAKAMEHIEQSLRIATKIRYFKLIGKNLILRLIFQNRIPAKGDRDLKESLRCFAKSRNEIERSDYALKLVQAYPELARKEPFLSLLRRMEDLYRSIPNRSKCKLVRLLRRKARSKRPGTEPIYDWWQDLLSVLSGPEPVDQRFQKALKELAIEFRSSFSAVYYLGPRGAYRQLMNETPQDNSVEIPSEILERVLREKCSLCLDAQQDAGIMRSPWIVLNDVRSILAVPVVQSNEVLAVWYFEKRGEELPFQTKDLKKAGFFAAVSSTFVETALKQEWPATNVPVVEAMDGLIGTGRAMQLIYRQIRRIAPVDINVLILGESGTGKEMIARNLHQKSKRNRGPMLALNCSAIPETLIESELFGYNRGAFTGAGASKPGTIERANGGTLFLDEIGDLSLAAQAKLLRVIQEKEIQRLGDTSTRRVDVRFLFATHKNLKRMVEDETFREDLFYRISAHVLQLPSLRERREDIPELVTHFLKKYSVTFGKKNVSISSPAMRLLCNYDWPGNVREMENMIQSVLIHCESEGVVDVESLPEQILKIRSKEKLKGLSLDEAREKFERDFLMDVLDRFGWNKTRSARELKISRQGLINLIQRLRLEEKR